MRSADPPVWPRSSRHRGEHAADDRPAVYLVTSADHPSLGADDRLLRQALMSAGVPVQVVVWTDPDIDWARSAACVVRSVWDYHLAPERFRCWLTAVDALTTVLNPAALIRWNMHKGYLQELAGQGIPTIETAWFGHGTQVDLTAVLTERGWAEAIVKPAVSASAYKTAKVTAGIAGDQRLLDDVLEHSDLMVQPYLSTIERDGEIAVVAIAGEVTHAARRGSALAGGIEATRCGAGHVITEEERRFATDVLTLLPEVPLYARVDLVRDSSGQLLLGELELIEPVLYLRHGPSAVQRLVAELVGGDNHA